VASFLEWNPKKWRVFWNVIQKSGEFFGIKSKKVASFLELEGKNCKKLSVKRAKNCQLHCKKLSVGFA